MTRAWRRLARWADGVDPAGIRRRSGARASLAAITAWLTIRLLTRLVEGEVVGGPALFGVVVCFIGAIAIGDARRAARLTTMVLAAGVSMIALAATASLHGHRVAADLMLLALMFAAFACRRFGLRAGELVLVATIVTYFTGAAGVAPERLGWYIAATAVGFISLVVWHLVIAFDPRRTLLVALDAYQRRGADVIAAVLAVAAGPGDDVDRGQMRIRLAQVQTTRRVLEHQLPAAMPGEGGDRLASLQLAIYSTEQGLTMIVEAVEALEDVGPLDVEVAALLRDGMVALEAMLDSSHAAGAEIRGARLAALRQAAATATTRSGAQDLRWLVPTVELARGAQSVATATARLRELLDTAASTAASNAGATKATTAATSRARPIRPAQRLHPTTVLGLQAVVAALIAAALGRALGLEHVNWAYWTAFIVVAGSAGESARRMVLRVTGTTCGAAAGAALAVLAPDRNWAVAALATVGIFMAVYEQSISYTRMVAWINVGFVITFAQLGAGELELVRQRTLAAAVGGVVAAIVARTLLPMRVVDRLRTSLTAYIDAVVAAVGSWIDVCADPTQRPTAEAASARCDAVLGTIRAAGATAAFERSPFPGTPAPWTDDVVRVTAIGEALTRVAHTAPDEQPVAANELVIVDSLGNDIVTDLERMRNELDRPGVVSGRTSPAPDRRSASAAELGDLARTSTHAQPVIIALASLRRAVRRVGDAATRAGSGPAPTPAVAS